MKTSHIRVLAACVAALTMGHHASADENDHSPVKGTPYQGAYYVDGEIHFNTFGDPEGKPLTSGHRDYKPSWSKIGDMLVYFRRLKNDLDVAGGHLEC